MKVIEPLNDIAYEDVAKYIQINQKEKTIYVSEEACPLHANIFYSVLMDIFANLEWMQHPIPIKAYSHTIIDFINGWSLDKHNKMSGLYISRTLYHGNAFVWGEPNGNGADMDQGFVSTYIRFKGSEYAKASKANEAK